MRAAYFTVFFSLTLVLSEAFLIPRLVLYHRVPAFTQARNGFELEYGGFCHANASYPYFLDNFSFVRNGTTMVVSGRVTTTRDLRGPISSEFQLSKCEDTSSKNSCRVRNAFRWPDLCDWRKLTIVPAIRSLMDKIEPPLRCPIKKGHYLFRNIKLDSERMQTFLARNTKNQALWIGHMSMHESRREIGCYEIGARITNPRNGP